MNKYLDSQKTAPFSPMDENMHEMARLIRQYQLMNDIAIPVISKGKWAKMQRFLDIGCGPGSLLFQYAPQHQHCQFIGIDPRKYMLQYAQFLAQLLCIKNVTFLQTGPGYQLPLAYNSIDCIMLRFASSYLPANGWTTLLRECQDILHPGGMIVSVECEHHSSTSLAFDYIIDILKRASVICRKSLLPMGRSSGISPQCVSLFERIGFSEVHLSSHMVDTTPKQKNFPAWIEDMVIQSKTVVPLLVSAGLATHEELYELFTQALADMRDPRFSHTACYAIYSAYK